MKKCCFTGNRAYKLPWKENEKDERCLMLKAKLNIQIVGLIEQGFDYFISGMAQGIDTYLAEIVLDLKKLFPNILLECAAPCKTQAKYWEQKDIERYNKILAQADKVTYVFENYNKFCNQVRNRYMVNNSELVLAVWNGEKSGGSYMTIKYAQKAKKPIVFIDL
ncbi:MAG: SLOG family protein [Clostridia bacterium]